MLDLLASTPPDLADPGEAPVHARIADWLERQIVAGRLRPGDKLPTEVDIAAALGVSRMTLRQALASLAGKGLLESRRGRTGGNFVTRPRLDFSLGGLPGFTEQMRQAHVAAGAVVVEARTRPAHTYERDALRLRRGARVHEVVRVRSANGEPVALEETMLPAAVFPGLLGHDLTASLYELMRREYDRSPHSAEEVVEPVIATPDRARLLGVAEGAPLLMITRTSYTEDGVPVEFARDCFRPDRSRIVLRTQVDQPPSAKVSATRS